MKFSTYASAVLVAILLTLVFEIPAHSKMQQPPKSPEQSLPSAPAISGQVTFLYCNDIAKSADFYAKLLGKKPTLDLDWVKIFPVTDSLSVGLVDKDHGALHPSDQKPVMLSFVVQTTQQVDAWQARAKALGAADLHTAKKQDLKNGQAVYSFSLKDPEGYSIEFFAWTN